MTEQAKVMINPAARPVNAMSHWATFVAGRLRSFKKPPIRPMVGSQIQGMAEDQLEGHGNSTGGQVFT